MNTGGLIARQVSEVPCSKRAKHACSRESEQDLRGVVPRQSKGGCLPHNRAPFVRRGSHSNWWQDRQSALYESTMKMGSMKESV